MAKEMIILTHYTLFHYLFNKLLEHHLKLYISFLNSNSNKTIYKKKIDVLELAL
jgi:hypothetical protein